MNSKLKRGLGVALVGASSLVLASVTASPALADTTPTGKNLGPLLGSMYLSPRTGVGITNFNLQTAGPCPASSTRITGVVWHQDNAATGDAKNTWNDVNIVSKTTNGISTSGPMLIGITNNLYNTANSAAKNMQPGTYTIGVYCGNSLDTVIDGYYKATLDLANTSSAPSTDATYTSAGVPTTSTVSASPTSAQAGDPVTLDATVAPAFAASSSLTGTVEFFDGATSLGTAALDGAGHASRTVTSLPAGSRSITAQYTGSTSYATSTSAPTTVTVTPAPATATNASLAVAVNGAAVTSPATATTTDNVALTGTVSNSRAGGATPAGTCEFFDGAASLGTSTVTPAGTCTKSLGQQPAKAYAYTVRFTPTDSSAFQSSDTSATPFSLTVDAPSIAPQTETVNVTIDAGALTIGLKSTEDGIVSLATPVLRSDGAYLESLPQATGNVNRIDTVVVTDTRAGNPGWEARGIVSDFRSGPKVIRSNNLGWAPSPVTVKSASQSITAGPVVAPSTPPLEPTDAASAAGLGSSRQLAKALSGAGSGTAELGADLSLLVPTSTPAGTYSATLTLTVS